MKRWFLDEAAFDVSQRTGGDKGVLVDLFHGALYCSDLQSRYHAVENLLRFGAFTCAAHAAIPPVNRHAPVQLVNNRVLNLGAFSRDDRDRGVLLNSMQQKVDGFC